MNYLIIYSQRNMWHGALNKLYTANYRELVAAYQNMQKDNSITNITVYEWVDGDYRVITDLVNKQL